MPGVSLEACRPRGYNRQRWMRLPVACLLVSLWPEVARAQAPEVQQALEQPPPGSTAPAAAPPIGARERIDWIVDGVVGPRSLGVGAFAAGWQTGLDIPREWQRTWSGFGKRYLEREA